MRTNAGTFGWGTATGPLHRQPPEVVLSCTLLVFVSLSVAPVTTMPGFLFAVTLLALWLGMATPPGKHLLMVLMAGIVLFGPVFLLSPLIAAEGAASPKLLAMPDSAALLVSFNVFFKGIAGVLVTTTAVASMTERDLYNAIHRMPLPATVRAIVANIVVQTVALLRETRNIIQALTLRGAQDGWRASWLVATSLPRVWFPRIIQRAERNAMAMDLRGFNGCLQTDPPASLSHSARFLTAGCAIMLVLSLLLRFGAGI